LGDPREQIRKVCGDEVADKCKAIWGLDEEGELNGVWRDLGVPGLWYMMGEFAWVFEGSKLTSNALIIKATLLFAVSTPSISPFVSLSSPFSMLRF